MTQPTRRRYELMGGVHYEPNPSWKPSGNAEQDRMDPNQKVKYLKLPNVTIIVESDRRLDLVFANKFRDLSQNSGPVTDLRRAQVEELLKQEGGFCEEDRAFLEGLDEDGFVRVLRMTAARQANIQEKKTSGPASVYGDDVTDRFQQAYDNQFKVYRNAQGKHNVLRGGTKPLNKTPLAEENVESFVAQYLKEMK